MGSACCCFHVEDNIDNANNNNDVGFIPNLCNKIKELAASIKNGKKYSVNSPSTDQAAAGSSTAPNNEMTPSGSPSKSSEKSSSSGKRAKELVYLYDPIEHEDECPICLEEYTPENPKTTMQCSHQYHLACIYEWMERSENCPICSRVMVFDESS